MKSQLITRFLTGSVPLIVIMRIAYVFVQPHSNYKVGGMSITGSLVYRVRSNVPQAVGQGVPEFRQFRVPQCGATTVSPWLRASPLTSVSLALCRLTPTP